MIGIDALRADLALLKLDLYCQGVRLDSSCYVEEDGGRRILRTRAGLGSGPIGCAPNVQVSLGLLPEECRSLSPRRYPLQALKLKAIARVFARRFEKRCADVRAAA